VFIGTSGWQYPHWRQRFYPSGVPQARWLEHYSARFATVEVNNAFYRLPESGTFEDWKRRTPEDFVVTLKASRYITHVKRLREPEEPVKRLLERSRHLGPKLGPILLQLPPNLRSDLKALEEVLAQFPDDVRVAVEPRHESWFEVDTPGVLARHGAAFCLSDSPERKTPHWRTATWGYLRLHAGRADPRPCYGRSALRSWAERLAEMWPTSANVYVYFNNDACGCAVRDAQRFAGAARRVGLTPTRVPRAHEVSVGKE
jgi:uncharacterized protein YecE (DUF72 family)